MFTEVEVSCCDCGKKLKVGDWPLGCRGDGEHNTRGGNRLSAIHSSERTVVFRNPRTGEVRYPPTNTTPIHPKYARQGYERVELSSARDISQFEKSSGRLHERSHYHNGSATAERDLTPPEPHMPGLAGPESSEVLKHLTHLVPE